LFLQFVHGVLLEIFQLLVAEYRILRVTLEQDGYRIDDETLVLTDTVTDIAKVVIVHQLQPGVIAEKSCPLGLLDRPGTAHQNEQSTQYGYFRNSQAIHIAPPVPRTQCSSENTWSLPCSASVKRVQGNYGDSLIQGQSRISGLGREMRL
jgi:hypothetical protein